MIYSDILGRDSNLNLLEFQVNLLIKGTGSIVNIMGESGVGKSRLTAELKKREVIQRVNVLEGKAVVNGEKLNFYPISQLLKQWARIREEDNVKLQLEKLEKLLRSVYPEELEEILPFVATMMGVRLSEKYARRIIGIDVDVLEKLLFEKLRKLLSKASSQRPLIIILDDLHWADASSIKLLDILFELPKKEKILFINLFRPSFRYQNTSGWLLDIARENYHELYEEIELFPLALEEGEILIDNLLKTNNTPMSFKKRIVEISGGNPFFIEEIIRSFIDRGILRESKGKFDLKETPEDMVIPLSINDALMSRLNQLNKEVRWLLNIAAVIGKNIFYRVLMDVADVEKLDEKLAYMESVQLICKSGRAGEKEYLFNHALTQEAVYSSITDREKKELHLRTACSIEKVFRDKIHNFHGLMAYHYIQAEELGKAEEHMLKAGTEAMKASASSEAVYYYKNALKIYLSKFEGSADQEKELMLKKNILEAMFNKGDIEAIEYSENVLKYYGVTIYPKKFLGFISKWKAALSFVAAFWAPALVSQKEADSSEVDKMRIISRRIRSLYTNDFEKAKSELITLLLGNLAKLNISAKYPELVFMVVNAVWFMNLKGTALSLAMSRKILTWVKPRLLVNDKKLLLSYELARMQYNFFIGDWDKINRYAQDLVDYNLRTGEIRLVVMYLGSYGLLTLASGESYPDISEADRIEQIVGEYNDAFSTGFFHLMRASYLAFRGNVGDEEALKDLERRMDYVRKKDLKMFYLYMGYSSVYIKLLRGEIDEAGSVLRKMEVLSEHIPGIPALHSILRAKVRFYFFLVKFKQSIKNNDLLNLKFYRRSAFKTGVQAVKIAKKVTVFRPDIFRLQGVCYWLAGKQDKALKWFQKSIMECERIGGRLSLSRTYFEIGSCLLEEGSRYREFNSISADEYLEKARLIFIEMELDWDLEQLDKLRLVHKGINLGVSKEKNLETALRLTGSLLNNANSFNSVVRIILKEAERLFNAGSSLLLLKDEDTSYLSFYVVDVENNDIKSIDVYEEKGIYVDVLSSGKLLVENSPAKNKFFSKEIDEPAGLEAENLMAVPLKVNERIIGVFAVVNKNRGNFHHNDLEFFQLVSGQISIVLEQSKAVEEKVRAERLVSVGKAVAGLSHDIRGIVSGLKYGQKKVGEHIADIDEDGVIKAWDIMGSSIDRISDLSVGMVEYSANRELIYRPYDLNLLISEMVEAFEYDDKYKDAKIELDLHPNLEKIGIDPGSMDRCLRNLIKNALEATEGQDERNVVVATRKRGDRQVEIKIEDNGRGVEESDRERLFEMDFSTKGSRGSGFGLMIAKKSVDEHKGEIRHFHKTERGSMFKISLPID